MRGMKMVFRRMLVGAAALTLLAGCGDDHAAGEAHGEQGGAPAATSRDAAGGAEVRVVARDMAFESVQKTFEANKPYRFSVQNTGLVDHEWVLTKAGAPASAHGHDDHAGAVGEIGSAELKPGSNISREVVFTEPGEYEMACHLTGHYEAGMKLVVQVR